MKSKPHKTTETKEQQNTKTTKTNATTTKPTQHQHYPGCSQRSWRSEIARELNATHSQHLFSVTKPSSPVRTSLLNYSAEKADLIPLCRRTKFCLQFLCTPVFLQSKNFPALTPKWKINWQNQKGTSELKTQTKLFQAQSSISKGSKLKNSLLPGPQKWGHFSAEKPVTWEGASPVDKLIPVCDHPRFELVHKKLVETIQFLPKTLQ